MLLSSRAEAWSSSRSKLPPFYLLRRFSTCKFIVYFRFVTTFVFWRSPSINLQTLSWTVELTFHGTGDFYPRRQPHMYALLNPILRIWSARTGINGLLRHFNMCLRPFFEPSSVRLSLKQYYVVLKPASHCVGCQGIRHYCIWSVMNLI